MQTNHCKSVLLRPDQRKVFVFFAIAGVVLLSLSMRSGSDPDIGVSHTVTHFKNTILTLEASAKDLLTAIQLTRKDDTSSVGRAKQALKNCRIAYKRMEFFTCYFFPSETKMYNSPPKYEVEEPTLELEEPMGLQQIEVLLFDPEVMNNKPELLAQADALYSSASDLKSLLYQFEASDQQILESLRIELIRVYTLSVSGYDAPLLKSSIPEALAVFETLDEILRPYIDKYPPAENSLKKVLENSIKYLRENPDFDSFDRMEFMTKFAIPLQKELNILIRFLKLDFNSTQFLNYDAEHIFQPGALKIGGGGNGGFIGNKHLVSLGKRLFYDTSLSGNLSSSCATCHKPGNHFADTLPKSLSIQPDSVLKRNTPSLLYAGRQHSQFWDGRAKSLQEQIKEVILSPLELNGSKELLAKNVLLNDQYRDLLKLAYPGMGSKRMGIDEIATALAAFVGQLGPMNSVFDRYINGEQNAMTESQIKGFNLFMGKAQCGTCHFPPYFNALLPPFYELSEVEVIGTTLTDNFKVPVYDNDQGRFELYNIRYFKRAFKTPTVRNTEKTAPYMHNGSFKSLNTVLEFYNLGGGRGLGLNVEDQTMSSEPLNLSEKEIGHLIQFIHSLTDSINHNNTDY
jgi:cytochrome c peroxidase